jgi:hypothetical protein
MNGRLLDHWARVTVAAAIGLTAMASSEAAAYCITTKNNPWSSPGSAKNIVFNTLVPSSMRTVIEVAIKSWNMSGSALVYGTPTYAANFASQPFFGQYMSFTSVGLPDTLPAVSSKMDVTPTHPNGQLGLNSSFTWTNDTQNIPWKIADAATVVIHEIGHFNGMSHPENCSDGITANEAASVMTVVNSTLRRYLNVDDTTYQKWRY